MKNNFDIGNACKWAFGSLATIVAVCITKDMECLHLLTILALLEFASTIVKTLFN